MIDTTTDHNPLHARERLAAASGAALLVAGVVLVIAVLPAEFGVDPTGIGRRLGLTAMNDVARGVEKFTAARAAGANVLLMLAGFVLAGEQLAGYIFGGAVS